MCHLILGSYQEQALDQELDFSQALLEASLQAINPLKCQEHTVEQAVVWDPEVGYQAVSDLVVSAVEDMEDMEDMEQDKAESLRNQVMAI